MSDDSLIHADNLPHTVESLAADFAACGLAAGQTVLVHSSMRKIGWIAGGEVAVIQALLRVLGETGTLMTPTHTADNTDPARWQNPPIPEHWWPIFREHAPAFDPALTPTWHMGAIAELFRRWPGVIRSGHPVGSFAALGPNAAYLTADHTNLSQMFGDESPIGKLYALDGYVLLLGVTHENDTSLHLAEYRADWPGKTFIPEGSAMLVDGKRQWVAYEMQQIDSDDFAQIGDAYEAANGISRGRVGAAEVRFMKQRPLVDYAVHWMNKNRKL